MGNSTYQVLLILLRRAVHGRFRDGSVVSDDWKVDERGVEEGLDSRVESFSGGYGTERVLRVPCNRCNLASPQMRPMVEKRSLTLSLGVSPVPSPERT